MFPCLRARLLGYLLDRLLVCLFDVSLLVCWHVDVFVSLLHGAGIQSIALGSSLASFIG